MTDYDYTRDITTECSDEDNDSIFDAVEGEEIYQSTQSLAEREEDELDRFERSKTKEELAEIYGISSDDEDNRAGPSNRATNIQQEDEEEERYISGQYYRQHTTMDVSDDMSPNATSTGDEKERGGDTPGVSDEVHRMTLVEEATNEQRMEIDEEDTEEMRGEKEKVSEKKTKRTQPSRRKKK